MTYQAALTEYLALSLLRERLAKEGGRNDLQYALRDRIEKAKKKIIRTVCPKESDDGPW